MQTMLTLTLLPDVKSVLTATFRMADLVRIDFTHTFSLLVKEEGLIDTDLIDLLRLRIEETPLGGKLAMNNPEVTALYVWLDLFCKSYFTSFSTILEREHKAATGAGVAAFTDQRDQMLGTASLLLAKFREIAARRVGFEGVEQKLALVEQTML
jgi:hypothetical protein